MPGAVQQRFYFAEGVENGRPDAVLRTRGLNHSVHEPQGVAEPDRAGERSLDDVPDQLRHGVLVEPVALGYLVRYLVQQSVLVHDPVVTCERTRGKSVRTLATTSPNVVRFRNGSGGSRYPVNGKRLESGAVTTVENATSRRYTVSSDGCTRDSII